MPRLAQNRNIGNCESISGNYPRPAAPETLPVWPNRGPPANSADSGSRNRALHRLVVRTAAAFRWNPGNVAVRVLHVAGFAMDAILRVDDKARTASLLDPFIDP